MSAVAAHLPKPASSSSTKRSLALVVGVLAALLALPLGVALGAAWIDMFGPTPSGRAAPQWVMPGTVRATTNDGTAVRARVALDIGSSGSRDAVQRRMQQVSLVLEVSVGSHRRRELSGSQGIQNLADDMLERLNDYLGQEGVTPIRSVAIQDLIVGSN